MHPQIQYRIYMNNKRLITEDNGNNLFYQSSTNSENENDIIMNASAQRLKNFHKNYCKRLYQQKVQKSDTQSSRIDITRKFHFVPHETQGESIEITNYLDLVHKQRSSQIKHLSVVIPQIIKLKRHPNSKTSVPILQLSRSKVKRKPWGRRLAVIINPPAHEFLNKHKAYEIITQIVAFYEEFRKLGLSESKLINVIANCCHEKDNLSEIFRQKHLGLKDINTYINYIKDSEQIFLRMKQYVLQCTQKQLKELIRDISIYKNEISQVYNDHLRIRLGEIEKSIIKMRERGIHNTIPSIDINQMDASNIIENLTRVEDKNGEFKLISKSNRFLHNCLNLVEQNLKYSGQKK